MPGHKEMSLHRFLLEVTDSKVHVDHINGDILDNRKSNLRKADNRLNHTNQRLRKDNKAGYKGVSYRDGKFYARIGPAGKIHIGIYPTAEEAAKAYDAKAKELYGEYARLNFPDDVATPLKGLPVGPTIYGKERRQTTDDHLPHHPAHHVLLRHDGRPAEAPEMTAAGESACDHEERRKCLWEPDAPSRS